MRIQALSSRLETYLDAKGIRATYIKQIQFFTSNPRHPSLHTELLEPKHLGIYSFRITKQYRAIFVYIGHEAIEIVDINHHYR